MIIDRYSLIHFAYDIYSIYRTSETVLFKIEKFQTILSTSGRIIS